MRLNHLELVLKHPSRRFGTVETLRTPVKDIATPCCLCNAVVREGLRRVEVLEPPRPSAEAPCTPCFPCKAVVREGPYIALLVMMWFKKVRGGSMCLNH